MEKKLISEEIQLEYYQWIKEGEGNKFSFEEVGDILLEKKKELEEKGWQNLCVMLYDEQSLHDSGICTVMTLWGDRLETTREFNKRIKEEEREKIREEKKKEAAAKKRKMNEERERRTYERLKKKFEKSGEVKPK